MKIVYLIRHAKSSWSNPDCNDFDRELNNRGKKDAKIMAKVFKKYSSSIDYIVSSKAVRARETAKLLFSEGDSSKVEVHYDKKLYDSTSEELLEYFSKLSNNINSIALIAHNPGLTDFVNACSNVKIDNLPTSGIIALEFDIKKWAKVLKSQGSLLFFDYPKNHKD